MPGDETPRERPRPSLLIALGVAVVAFLAYWTWPSAGPGAAPSNLARDPRARQTAGQTAPGSLDVRLDALKQPPPEPRGAERNPFRFQPKPPPAPPPQPMRRPSTAPVEQPPPAAPEVPPIPLKFFGIVEGRPGKFAALSDGRFVYYGREGEVVEGRYRIVKIGVESIILEYIDGRGRQTIPLRGQ
jgi:hypothetical protein